MDAWTPEHAAAGVVEPDGVRAWHGDEGVSSRGRRSRSRCRRSRRSWRSRRASSTSTSRRAAGLDRAAPARARVGAAVRRDGRRSRSPASGGSTRTPGFEVLAQHLERRAEMPFAEYLSEAVLEPLESRGELRGSPASGLYGTLLDLLELARELLAADARRAGDARGGDGVAFPGLVGVLPDFGRQEPNDWGLGVELRDGEVAALDGLAQLAADVRPLRRERDVPLGRPGRAARARRAHGQGLRRLGGRGEAGLACPVRRSAGRSGG